MTQIYALTGSPGAKAQHSFAGRGHSIAKRRRDPAGEPLQPDSTCHAFPAWFSWSQLGGCSNQGGWKRLTGEGRRRPWQVRCFPRAPDSSPPVDSGKPPEDPALLPLQKTSQGPWGGTQACEDDISRDTGRRWPTELRGNPRTGLGWKVWVHIKGTRGFLCSGDP